MTDKEKARKLRDIAESLTTLGVTAPEVREIADELDPPICNAIPKGELCWGYDNNCNIWRPCQSNGDGTGTSSAGYTYYTIRLVHPDRWPINRYAILYKDGRRSFCDDTTDAKSRNVVYYEVRP
jgi:hypothetical protein